MSRRLDFGAVVVEARRRCPPGRTGWIGIDGLGGSGKTTLAARLAEQVDDAVVVHLDDFARRGVPTWDHDLFRRQVLDPLRSGRPARYRRWDHRDDVGLEWVEVSPGRPVVAEGVSATDHRLGLAWDLTVWVDTPADVRERRIVERDGVGLAERWRTDWIPQETRYLTEQRPDLRADVVIAGCWRRDAGR